LGQISTSLQSLLQIEWKAFQMALESNECQKDVEWGAQEMFVKTYTDNLKFLIGSISDEAYQACWSIGLVNATSLTSWNTQLFEQLKSNL
jgi:hypothetical protein